MDVKAEVRSLRGLFVAVTALLCVGLIYLPTTAESQDVDYVLGKTTYQGSSYATFIENRNHLSIIELGGSYDRYLSDGTFNQEPRAVIAQEYYANHADNVDFLIIFTSFEFDTGPAAAFHVMVRNEVQGINAPMVDLSADFGSDGVLQGYIDMAALTRWQADPAVPEFDITLQTLVHEVFHQWAARVRYQDGSGILRNDLLDSKGAHWCFLLDTDASVMYGSDWRDNGDGSFTSIGASRLLSPLDLYLAGFASAAEVPPLTLIRSTDADCDRLPEANVVVTGSTETITIDDIIAAEGPRLPAAVNAQRDFRAAFIYVVRPDQIVDDLTVTSLESIRAALLNHFPVITGGRAVMNVYPSDEPGVEVGAPDPLDGGELRITVADLDDALAWLRGEQRSDGAWQDRVETTPRDTAVVLKTLHSLDPLFVNEADALSWLREHQVTNTDELARSILAQGSVTASDLSGLREQLLDLQNDDGGWGVTADFASDSLDTAVAVLALVDEPDVPAIALQKAGSFLLAGQGADGGWAHGGTGSSRIAATTAAVEALDRLGLSDQVTDDVISFLTSRQNPDGGFGDSPSTAHDTANVLLVAMSLDAVAEIDSAAAVGYLGSTQTVVGNWEGSTYTTSLVATALKRYEYPNLVALHPLSAEPSSPHDGDEVRVTATIENNGSAFAPPSTARLYRGHPDTGGVLVGEMAIPTLALGGWARVTFAWDTLDQSGVHELHVFVDPDDLIDEMSEADNSASVTVEVEPPPAGVDLLVHQLLATPAQPDYLPVDLTISGSIRNLGLSDAGEVAVTLWQGEAGTGTRAGETSVILGPRSSADVSFAATLSAPGTVLYTLEVDPDDLIAEANESNNLSSVTVTPTGGIDLEITPGDITMEGDPWLGYDLVFTVRVRNRGIIEAPDLDLAYLIDDGSTQTELRVDQLSLAAGEEVEREVVWRADRAGSLSFVASLDPEDRIIESDETNNLAGFSFSISEASGANLAVSHHDMSFDPTPADEGQPVTMAAVVRNTGSEDLTDVELAFYDNDPASGGVQLGELVVIPALAAGTTQQVTVESVLSGPGEHLIFVVADPRGLVDELDEDDNSAFSILVARALPDLSVHSLSFEPELPEAGETVSVTAEILNSGDQDAVGVGVRIVGSDGTTLADDQTLSLLAGHSSATLSFTWTYPEATASVLMTVTADPESTIPEGNEGNNSASRTVIAFDPDQALSNRYISPNGDGIKDSTVFFFTAPEPSTATVSVEDSDGRVVRSSEAISATPDGSFEWDGRSNAGKVVGDGEYRLIATDIAGDQIREAVVTVDTNRLPLFDPDGELFVFAKNLTCGDTSLSDPLITPAEEWLFLRRYYEGFARLPLAHPDIELIGESWGPEWGYDVSDDDQKIAFIGDYYFLYHVNTDGTELTTFSDTPLWGSLAFRPGTDQDLIYAQDGIRVYPLDGSGSERVLTSDGSFYRSGLSPNGRYLIYEVGDWMYTEVFLLDLDSGQVRYLIDYEPGDGSEYVDFYWSPDSSRFVLGRDRRYEGWYELFSASGDYLGVIEPPMVTMAEVEAYSEFDPPAATIAQLNIGAVTWSDTSQELVFEVDYEEGGSDHRGYYGGLFHHDISTGDTNPLAWIEPVIDYSSYHISTWSGSEWVERGEVHLGLRFGEERINLGGYLPDADGEYKVRIRQTGREAAHIDMVALRQGRHGEGMILRPAAAIELSQGRDVTAEIRGTDREVLDAFERQIEVRWSDLEGASNEPKKPLYLVLVAREETLSDRAARPFSYPASPDRVYSYLLTEQGKLEVDGLQSAADQLTEPLFCKRSYPDTGHPAADVCGYVTSDGELLYAALDFTVDNTQDGDRDWAALWVRGRQGWVEYRVTEAGATCGAVGFTHTGKVHHRHKYYEFKVALAELGLTSGDLVDLRFEAYGTAALIDSVDGLLPRGGQGIIWTQGRRVLYTMVQGPSYLIDLNDGSSVRPIFEDLDGINDPMLSPSGARLFVQSARDILDPASPCYNPLADLWDSDWFMVQSLANLSASLSIRPADNDGRSYFIHGTAADLNFAGYQLEYLDEENPDLWIPIGSTTEQQVIDAYMTTWVPPAPGSYRVRLTVHDLAGNQATAIQLLPSAGSSTSISQLSLDPHVISPNGDNVQDETTLHYRVMEPVHLEVAIYNESGDRVRLIERDHSTIGTEHELVWDGRNDQGWPVADGEYRLEVQSYRFYLTVDAAPPEIDIKLFDAFAHGILEPSGEDVIYVDPKMTWCVEDEHLQSATMMRGVGEEPSRWDEVGSIDLREECDPDKDTAHLKLEDFVGYRYRIEARDDGGNLAVATSRIGSEELIVLGVDASPERPSLNDIKPIPFDGWPALNLMRKEISIRLVETARHPLTAISIAIRPQGEADWLEIPMPYEVIEEHALELLWGLAEVPSETSTAVQIRAIDEQGDQFVSNLFNVHVVDTMSFAGVGPFSCTRYPQIPPIDPVLKEAVRRAGFDCSTTPYLWAYEKVAEPLTDFRLILRSTEDPVFTGGVPISPAGFYEDIVVFDGSMLKPCLKYNGVVFANLPDQEYPIQSNHEEIQLDCIEVDIQLEPQLPEECGTGAPQLTRATLTPLRFNPVELRTMTLALETPDNVIFNVNLPEPDHSYSHELDTSGLAEGSYKLIATLTNGEGEQVSTAVPMAVDHSPPVVEMTHPLDGQYVCGIVRDDKLVVDIEGTIEDLGRGFTYSLQLYDPIDEEWTTFAEGEELAPPVLSDLPVLPLEMVELNGLLGELGLSRFYGEVTIRLEVTDLGGEQTCIDRVFTVDGEVDASGYVDTEVLSPNGDGVTDLSTVHFASAEAILVDLAVYNAVSTPTGWLPQGPPVITLATGLPSLSAGTLPWDGRDSGGSIVADGSYVFVLTLTDACGNSATQTLPVSVDNTPPEVEITLPQPGTLDATMVEVWGTVLDLHLQEYELDVSATGTAIWSRLAIGSTATGQGLIALWNTSGMLGDYTLRLWARDRAGNESIALIAIELTGEGNLISSLEATPFIFSPNNDSRRDSTAVRFGLHAEATVTVQIETADEDLIRTLAGGESLPAGAAVRPWDGLDDDEDLVADGSYHVRLIASGTDGSRQEEVVSVIVDTTPPALTVDWPSSGYTPGAGSVIGTISDAYLNHYSVSLTSTPDAPVWQQIASGHAQVFAGELASLEGLEEGGYAVKLEAYDDGENFSSLVLPFVVDNTPPEVELLAPTAGAMSSGEVMTLGSCVESNPGSWRLELGAGENPGSWDSVASGAGLPAWPQVWESSLYPDGTYTLRLAVLDLAGHQAQATVVIGIDNTSPLAEITAPSEGAYVTAPTVIQGTASDADLLQYVVEVAAPGSELWLEVGRGISSVSNGPLLVWEVLPPDGEYLLRLTVEDGAGHSVATAVTMTIDTTPPEPPTGLAAIVENGEDVALSWAANGESDLAGYNVYCNGHRITPDLVADPSYLDQELPEGSYTYTVTAVDRAGLESEPSLPADAEIDLTPPTATIHRPRAQESVSGTVAIRVTVLADDLLEYRIFADAGLLYESPIAVQAQNVAQWDTQGLAPGAVTLRLEAEDVNGNVGVDEAEVMVDNQPPAAPTGLVAVATGDDVDLSWNANPEPDVHGYLLTRGGVLIGVPQTAGTDLRPFAIAGTSSMDSGLPDGTHVYTVLAIDEAGNTSPPSAPADVSIDLRAPHAEIITPVPGTRFDSTIFVLASCDDNDVAEVSFKYQEVGEASWHDLGTDTAAPWEVYFDPDGLDYGDYLLQAVAIDDGGQTDPAPAPIEVTYTELERPAQVQDATALVDGGDVEISWSANSEPDLAGYHVDRLDEEGNLVRITATPVGGTSLVDSDLLDAVWTYTVIAIDSHDNESDPSTAVPATVYTPVIEPPVSPTRLTSVDLTGSGAALAAVEGEVRGATTTGALPPTTSDEVGLFSIQAIPLEAGVNTISLTLLDAAGNRSKQGTTRLLSDPLPSAPTGLAASVSGNNVALSWNPNPEASVVGYQVYRDGEALVAPTAIPRTTFVSTSASSTYSSYVPSRAVDGSSSTYWSPQIYYNTPGQWWQGDFDQSQMLGRVTVVWRSYSYRAIDFDIQALHLDEWVVIAEVRGNSSTYNVIDLDQHFDTQAIRVVIQYSQRRARLAEVSLFQVGMVSGTSYNDNGVSDGFHDYTVSALTRCFEGPQSEILEVGVGDVLPPDPVVLSASVSGSDVSLSWTASDASDIWGYYLDRNGNKITETTGLAFTDTGLVNGDYTYVVRAVDNLTNIGEPSNEVVVTVAVPVPEPPQDLVVQAPPEGGLLGLSWLSGPGPAPVAYSVHRSILAGGPYDQLGIVSSTSYDDDDVENGTTYFYVVRALDVLGNASAPSNEASGTPLDNQPPAPPILLQPGRSGSTFVTNQPLVPVLSGLAEAGSVVTVYQDSNQLATLLATSELEVVATGLSTTDTPRLSPDGRHLWLDGRWSHSLYDLASGTQTGISEVDSFVRWFADSDRVAYVSWDSDLGYYVIRSYRVSNGGTQQLALADYAQVAVPSPDGEWLAVLGESPNSSSSDAGIWLVDRTSKSWSLVEYISSYWTVNQEHIRWSPDGSTLAYQVTSPTYAIRLYAVSSEATETIALTTTSDTVSFVPDSSALLFSVPDGGGDRQLWRYHLADGSLETLTDTMDHRFAAFTADGEALVYIFESANLVRHELASDTQTVLYELAAFARSVQLTSGGQILVHDDREPIVLTPAGHFQIENLILAAGDNLFTAEAADDEGNLSSQLAPLNIQLTSDGLADLSVTPADLVVLPSVPIVEDTVRVSVTVRNSGEMDSTATPLSLVLIDPESAAVDLSSGLDLPVIPAGGFSTTAIDISFSSPGVFTLLAVVDPLGSVAEVSEDNNSAEKEIVVLAEAGPVLTVTTDRLTYLADEEALISVHLLNGGATLNGQLQLQVEDLAGYPAVVLPTSEISELGYGEVFDRNAVWSIGTTYAGEYVAVARLLDNQGAEIAAATAPLEIVDSVHFTAEVVSDLPSYRQGETVALTVGMTYADGNSHIDDAEVRVILNDPDGAEVTRWQQALGSLLPGAESSLQISWQSYGAVTGEYTVSAEVTRQDQALARAGTTFDVVQGAVELDGHLSLSPALVPVGVEVVASYEVRNLSAIDVVDMPVRLVLYDPGQFAQLVTINLSLTIAAGERVDGSAVFATSGLWLGSYLVVLEADLPAGLRGPRVPTIATASFSTQDRTPPAIEVALPQNDGFMGVDSMVAVTAVDSLSRVIRAEVMVDGGAWLPLALTTPTSGLWTSRLAPLSEEQHWLRARSVDEWGNAGETPDIEFVVDRTAPLIIISGVEDQGSYVDPVTPVIELVDAHDASFSAALDGQPYDSGTQISREGTYTLIVWAEDAVGNRSQASIQFTLGQPPPAGLAAEKTVTLHTDLGGDAEVSPGDVLQYQIEVRNSGEVALSSVTVVDEIPALTTLDAGSVTVTQGVIQQLSPLRVILGSLDAAAAATITFRVAIDSDLQTGQHLISNQGQITCNEVPLTLTDDPSLAGSSDPTDVTVIVQGQGTPILIASKTATLVSDLLDDGEASPNDIVEYSLTIHNQGEAPALGVVLLDQIPDYAQLISGSVVSDGVIQQGSPLEILLGTLGTAETTTVRFRVRVSQDLPPEATELVNQGEVRADDLPLVLTDDPNLDGDDDPTVTPLNHLRQALIPTLGSGGVAILVSLLLATGLWLMQRERWHQLLLDKRPPRQNRSSSCRKGR